MRANVNISLSAQRVDADAVAMVLYTCKIGLKCTSSTVPSSYAVSVVFACVYFPVAIKSNP